MFNGGGSPAVTNCIFSDNLANYGAGMWNYGSSPTLTNCTFSGNIAEGMGIGGGMYNEAGSNPTVTNCTFSGNTASSSGGGIYNNSSSPTVTNCTFANNQTQETSTNYGGGGMCNSNSNPVVTDCNFSLNSAGRWGGGMYNSSSSPAVTNCTFSGNTAYTGAGMFNQTSHPMLSMCTFSGNSSGWSGGGMCNEGSSPTVTNCTFTGNTASNNGGGMGNYSGSSPSVTNCIFWGDTPDEIFNSDGIATVTYSDVKGGYSGTGNINADPCFVDEDNPDPNVWNLRLSHDSPCIDAGDTTAVPGGTWADIGGNPRILDDPQIPDTGVSFSGLTVDMGAYEFYCTGIHGDINCDGVVDFRDVAILCNNWLAGTEPE
jgi:parallel beta-helix repeat protein